MLSKIFTTVKYLLCSVNFIFLITGIIILSVGSSVQSAYNGYHEFLTERFFSLPSFCIACGVFVFLIAFFGFYGAITENYYMNMVYAGSMAVMFIFQLSACIAGYALYSNAVALVQQQLQSTMELYGPSTSAVTKLWDEVQNDFECCGVTNADEWVVALHSEEKGVPISCCQRPYGTVHTLTCNTTIAYKDGCSDVFGTWVKGHAKAIGVAGIFLVLLQALILSGALWMANMLRKENSYP